MNSKHDRKYVCELRNNEKLKDTVMRLTFNGGDTLFGYFRDGDYAGLSMHTLPVCCSIGEVIPDEIRNKTGDPVLDILFKNPESIPVMINALSVLYDHMKSEYVNWPESGEDKNT